MNRLWTFLVVIVLVFAAGSVMTADDKEKTRNPFNVKDVPDPDGEEVKAFAAKVKLAGDAKDANAEQWVEKATAGKAGSLEGEWSSRWNSPTRKWITGTAIVKKVGDRVYILYTDRTNTYLIDAKLQGKSRLVGRSLNQGVESDLQSWVGEIVNDERIDGQWTNGRWDLRRKIADK
jgi:hypothetical protein